MLISGFIGYKSNKYSNLLYLWLCTVFYSIGIHIYFKNFRNNSIINYNLSRAYFPVVFEQYWYFTIYFGMYLFLPVINKGISLLTKVEFKLLIISLIGVFSFWKNIKNPQRDIFKMSAGYSIPWFLSLYLTGAYIGKYKPNYKRIKKFFLCLICLFIYGIVTLLYYKKINNQLNLGNGYLKNKIILILTEILNLNLDSVLKVAQSISISLFLLQINYNKYIGKFITFCGPLTFGVYLIHINVIFGANVLDGIFKKNIDNLSLYSTLLLIIIKDLKIYFFCILIEYLRFIIFKYLRIKKICIFIETMIFKLLS